MGLSGSRNCKENLRHPDILTVVTFTDSFVQRLPLDFENSTALEREAREQNVDDFWKDRMECIENAFTESMGLTEKKFNTMEKRILSMTPPVFKPKCPLPIAEVESCVSSFPEEPMRCHKYIEKLLLCVDTTIQDESRKACLKAMRDARKKKCLLN